MGVKEEETEKIIAELKKYLLHGRISSNRYTYLIMLIMLRSHPFSTRFVELMCFKKLDFISHFTDKHSFRPIYYSDNALKDI